MSIGSVRAQLEWKGDAMVTLRVVTFPTRFILLHRIPLFLALQDILALIESLLIVEGARVVLLTEECSSYALILQCAKASDAATVVATHSNRLVPHSLCDGPLGICLIDEDVQHVMHVTEAQHPIHLPHAVAAGKQSRGNSPVMTSDALAPPPAPAALCTICLDAVHESAAIRLLCGHSFHWRCIAQCSPGEPCPLCRFDMNLIQSASGCSVCACVDDLWMCVICGQVSCGRSQTNHSEAHFHATGHSHAVQAGGCRVWDYSADSFVHRLALVENGEGAPRPKAVSQWCDEEDEEFDRIMLSFKVDTVCEYYSRLLTQQLQEQQVYFETLLQRTSTCTILAEEAMLRRELFHRCVAEYRSIYELTRRASRSIRNTYRGLLDEATAQVAFLKTTHASLITGNEKLAKLIHDKTGSTTKSTELRKKIAELEKETEKLLSQVCV